MAQQKPTGVLIIVILTVIGALLGIFGAISLLGLMASPFGALLGAVAPALSGLTQALLYILIVVSILSLFSASLLWKMLKKGWTLTMVLEVISIVLAAVTQSYTAVVLPVIILIYLFTIKDLFK